MVGREAGEVVGNGGDGFDSYKKSDGRISQVVSCNWLDEDSVMKVARLVEKVKHPSMIALKNQLSCEYLDEVDVVVGVNNGRI